MLETSSQLSWYEEHRARIACQKQDIANVLERGTVRIKTGHRIKGLNPDGFANEIRLSDGQILRRVHELDCLGGKLDSSRLADDTVTIIRDNGRGSIFMVEN